MSGWFRLTPSLIALLLLFGCEKKEPLQQSSPASEHTQSRTVVPEEVQGHWKAVKIGVLDRETNRQEIYTVDLGYEFTIPGSTVSVEALNFFPAFVLEAKVPTSVSNEPRNPAAEIVIREDGRELFKGWIFSLYPGNHNFQHQRFSFTLVDFIPITKKG